MVNNLIGIVLCGGNSRRMGTDKSNLTYFSLPQKYHVSNLLLPFCERVFISCNKQQSTEISKSYKVIVDDKKYEGVGPMASILTAVEKFPQHSFFLVACDYPFLTDLDLKSLVESRNSENSVICFNNEKDNFDEPLIAIYENDCLKKIREVSVELQFSLRKFIAKQNTKRLTPNQDISLKSIDSMEDYLQTKRQIEDGNY